MKYNSKEHLNEICEIVGWVRQAYSSPLTKNIINHCQNGNVEAEIPDADLEEGTWQGGVLIKVKNLSTETVINDFIKCSNADEISMENGILRLWWD